MVPNNHPENQTVYTRKSVVPGEKSYSDALIENEKKENHDKNDNHNIKIFTDSIPKGIKVKELNEQIRHGHARVHSFPGATSKQLLHYLDVNIEDSTDTVLIHIGVNDILQSVSNMDRLLLNVREMVRKCRFFGVKNMFVSGLVYTRRIRVNILNDLQKKLVDVCREMNVYYIDNTNIKGVSLFKDGLHLLDSGKKILAKNFVNSINNFLSVMHKPIYLT